MVDNSGPRTFKNCAYCGKRLPEKRTRRRRYCNQNCRKAMQRKRDKRKAKV